MERESVLLPGMAEPEPTEKSPLAPPAFTGGQSPGKFTQLQGKIVLRALVRTFTRKA